MKLLLPGGLLLYIALSLLFLIAMTIPQSSLALQSIVTTSAFYTGSLVLLGVFALFNYSARNTIGLWYTLLFLLGLFFVACLDGTAAHLWVDRPAYGQWVPLASLLLLNSSGLLLAAHAMDPRASAHIVRWRGTIQVLGLIGVCCLVAIPFVSRLYLALMANILFPAMVLAQLMSTLSWQSPGEQLSEDEYKLAGRFSRMTSLLFLLAIIALVAVAWYRIEQNIFNYAEISQVASRGIYLLLSVSLVITFFAHITGLRRDHDAALQRELHTARKAASESKQRLEMEREFSRMRELALHRRKQLSAASHDIRQPLVSLRLLLDKLQHSQPEQTLPDVTQALNYIDDIAASYAAESPTASEPTHTEQAVLEALPVNLLLQTVRQMFAQEALSKGIEIRAIPCAATAWVAPVDVMRCINNLLSNALNHSHSTTILLGCRREEKHLNIMVYDQGPGISEKEFIHLKQPGAKGSDSDGEGLGLATVAEIAKTNAYEFGMKRWPQQANCFYLKVPRHINNA